MPVVGLTLGGVVTARSFAFRRVFSHLPRGRGRVVVTVTGRRGTGKIASTTFVGGCQLASTDSIRSKLGNLLRGSVLARRSKKCRICSELFGV